MTDIASLTEGADETQTLSLPPDVEAKLLGDCFALLLDDIRRNRARRLAKKHTH